MYPIVLPSPHDYPMMIPWFLANSPWHPHSNRWLSGESSGAFHQEPHSRGRAWSPKNIWWLQAMESQQDPGCSSGTSSSGGSFSHPIHQAPINPWPNGVWGLQLFANRSLCPILSNGACRQKGWGELNNVCKSTIQKMATWSNLKQPKEKKTTWSQVNPEFIAVACCRLLKFAQHRVRTGSL
jgi:hypothetical protein